MAKQRPVPPGGRKPANTGERQATPVRPPTAPPPPGPRRPAAGDPSDPRPIAAPFMHHPAPAGQHDHSGSDQHVQGPAQWPVTSTGPGGEPPTLDHRFPGPGQPGSPQQPSPARPAPAAGQARPTPPRPTGRPMPSPRRTPPDTSLPAARPHYPSDQGRSPAQGDPARRGPVRQGGLSGPPDSGFTNGPRTASEPAGPRYPSEPTGLRYPSEPTSPHIPDETALRTSDETAAPHIPDEATALRTPDDPAALHAAHPGPADARGNQRSFTPRADTVGVAKVPPRRSLLPGLELQPMVHVGDMPAAVEFYERLGGEINHGDRTGEWVLMQVGTAQIGLVTRPPDPSRGESTVELNFTATMPLDRLEQLLRERGVTVVEVAVDRDLGTRPHVETPDGMPVKIHQVEPDLMV